MALYNTAREVLERVWELRDSHTALRNEVTARVGLSLAYANGRQWTQMEFSPFGEVRTWELDEEWDPSAQEIRVVDNRTGPLLRRVAASTSPTRIEFAVHPPEHRRGLEDAAVARAAQIALNGLDESAAITLAARKASFHRWVTGNGLIRVTLSRKQSQVSSEFATHPDGTPIEINDQWLRWDSRPITELIWDTSNKSRYVRDHSVLMHEEIFTKRRFEQTYGPIEAFGFDEQELPLIKDLAPYLSAAAKIDGAGLFSDFTRDSKSKGLRTLLLMESDPRDPNSWPELYLVVDATPGLTTHDRISGRVVNLDNPRTPYGSHGRPIFKLDAFETGQSVWSWSLPSVVMSKQDMLNIVKSLQFQELSARIFGRWLVDERSTNADDFAQRLSGKVGGVLTWSSAGQAHPPSLVTPPNTTNEYIPFEQSLKMDMDSDVHIAPINRGLAKTHVPQATQELILSESRVVVDNIIQDDKTELADAGKLTLGTLRRTVDSPNRMLARLRDQHGFGARELSQIMTIDPVTVVLKVTVREDSIISRSIDERTSRLDASLLQQTISPEEHTIAMVRELERPSTAAQARGVRFIERLIVDIMNGMPFQGLPHLNFRMFRLLAIDAINRLDMAEEEDQVRHALIEVAIEKQRKVSLEMAQEEAGLLDPRFADTPPPSAPTTGPLIPNEQGAPESINPLSNPAGSVGGLRFGLSSAG